MGLDAEQFVGRIAGRPSADVVDLLGVEWLNDIKRKSNRQPSNRKHFELRGAELAGL